VCMLCTDLIYLDMVYFATKSLNHSENNISTQETRGFNYFLYRRLLECGFGLATCMPLNIEARPGLYIIHSETDSPILQTDIVLVNVNNYCQNLR
jgi:hypothetical protein